jgi:dihydrolipoamide dehydrogenase
MGDAYDVIVVGAGTGGYSAALRAAELGQRVAIVERDERLGGTCLLRGCIPTKALLQSAAVMDTVERASEWGIKAAGEPDWSAIVAFEDAMSDKLVKGLTGLIRQRGIDVVHGTASIRSGREVDVAGDRLEAWYDRIPGSAVVIGAGAVGLEFASAYRSLGAEVTVVEALPRLAPLEDEEISAQIGRAFRRRGITAASGATVKEITDGDDTVQVIYEVDGASHGVTADVCLVAVGRGPVTDDLGLEAAGVSIDERGFVQVDDLLRTTADAIWAVGDVAATPLQLAHVAFTEGFAVAERIAGADVPPIDYVNIPRVTYCTPEIASVGLTEEQAREAGREVVIEKLDLRAIGKANIVGEGGIVKVVAEAGGGPVLGVHMIGPHVTDLIAEAMLITSWEATADDVAQHIHPHPTLSEGVGEAMLALAGKALHTA